MAGALGSSRVLFFLWRALPARSRPAEPGQVQRGDHRIPRRDPALARLRRGLLQPWFQPPTARRLRWGPGYVAKGPRVGIPKAGLAIPLGAMGRAGGASTGPIEAAASHASW